MDIVARARAFVESLGRLAQGGDREWRRCLACGSRHVNRHGSYTRRPWTLEGRVTRIVQRYECQDCGATHSEPFADLAPGRWYAREVQRYAMDEWLHLGSSLRRVAEWVRSMVGKQERWQIWHPLSSSIAEAERCHLGHSTVGRWLKEAGIRAEGQVTGMYRGIASSGQMGTDGLWVRLRGGGVRVLLMLRDSVTGLLWPPVVAVGEEAAASWEMLFARASEAGLVLQDVRAVVSDGAQGLLSYLRHSLPHVYQQRCIFHTWRNLGGELARQVTRVAEGLMGEEASRARERVREELTVLVHQVLDALSFEQAEEALAQLKAHPQGAGLWQVLNNRFIALLTHLLEACRDVGRVVPEWAWRDFRLRLSRGRNHGHEPRVGQAGLLFTIYRNFTPAQMRRERRRHYRHPGQSALQAAGMTLEGCSYLDALEV
jgi:hypothetical protein